MWKLASKSTNKEGFEEGRETTKEERLECPICWESFNVVENVPYVLWCGHTICKYCLLGLQRAIVIKSSALPFHLPFFVACPWCNYLSLRLLCNGTIKFPSKNYYLLWMVENINGCRSDSRSSNNKKVSSGHKDMSKLCDGVSNTDDERLLENRGWWNGVTRGYFRNGRLHDSLYKSMALVSHWLAKFALVGISLLMALYAIPVSAAVLGIYFFPTFALAVPSFLVLYFAFPGLNWLIREIAA